LDRLPKPDHIGPKQCGAEAAFREERKLKRPLFLDAAAAGASQPPEASMKLDQISAPGNGMQAVDILCDQGQRDPFFKLRQREMRPVGTLCRNDFSAPVIPLPNDLRAGVEGLGRGELFRLELFPESLGSPEGRDAAVCGN